MDCDDFTVSVNNGIEYVPLTASPDTPTVQRIKRLVDAEDTHGRQHELYYPNIGIGGLHRDHDDSVDASRYITHDIDVTRNYESRILGRFHDTMSYEECVIYTRERAQIINILKREKNVNTKKCMYVEDLVKEIAKIMEVHL